MPTSPVLPILLLSVPVLIPRVTGSTTIDPDTGESAGGPVTFRYCYTFNVTATAAGQGYSAVGGYGGSAFSVSCPFSYSNPDPIKLVLNPGPSETIIDSLGPNEISAGDPPYSQSSCNSVQSRIGDVILIDLGAFALVSGTAPSSGTSVTSSVNVTADLSTAKAVPTLSEWGMIIFMMLAGPGAAYYLRRGVKKTEIR